MAPRFQRQAFEVPEEDLQRLMSCIVECARPEEARNVERVLGALASLSASLDRGSEDRVVAFHPPPGTTELVQRALEAMARSDRHQARALRNR